MDSCVDSHGTHRSNDDFKKWKYRRMTGEGNVAFLIPILISILGNAKKSIQIIFSFSQISPSPLDLWIHVGPMCGIHKFNGDGDIWENERRI
jgi:hypothetical protein